MIQKQEKATFNGWFSLIGQQKIKQDTYIITQKNHLQQVIISEQSSNILSNGIYIFYHKIKIYVAK